VVEPRRSTPLAGGVFLVSCTVGTRGFSFGVGATRALGAHGIDDRAQSVRDSGRHHAPKIFCLMTETRHVHGCGAGDLRTHFMRANLGLCATESTECGPDRALLATRTGFIEISPIDLIGHLAPAKGSPPAAGAIFLSV